MNKWSRPFCLFLTVSFLSLIVQAENPQILSPASGQVTDAAAFGDGAVMTLRWSSPPEAEVIDWAVYIGSEPGAWDYHRITHMNRYHFVGLDIPEEEALKIGIPADGSTFYVRLFWKAEDTDFNYLDAVYIAPVLVDSDVDGVLDSDDAFPDDSTESVDTDSDGVGDNTDTDDDDDGMPDSYELAMGYDPLVDDASSDADSDGQTNLQAYQALPRATQYLQTNSASLNITSIHIVNTSDASQSFTGSIYNGDGTQLGQANQPLASTATAPKGRLVLDSGDIETIFETSTWSGPAILKVTGTDTFELMAKLISPSGLTSNTNCVREDRVLNIEGFDSTNSTYVRFINTTDSAMSEIRGSLYDADGNVIGTGDVQLQVSLEAKQQIWISRATLASLVGVEWEGEALLEVDATIGLKLLNLNFINGETFFNFSCFEASDTTTRTATAYLQTTSTSQNVSSTHIVNASDTEQRFTGTLYNGDGEQLGTAGLALHSNSVAANGRVILSSTELETVFSVSPWSGPAMLEVTGTGNFELMTKLTSPSGLISNTNCVRSDQVHNVEGSDSSAMTYIRFINTGSTALSNIKGTLYDAIGDAIGETNQVLVSSLPAKSATWVNRDSLIDIFGDTWNGEAMLQVESAPASLRLLNLNFINNETFFNFSCYESSKTANSGDTESYTYPIVDTAQTECYDSSTGQTDSCIGTGYDADYAGASPAYVVSLDGLTVTDSVTELVWVQSSDSNNDGDINYSDKMTQTEAASYCSSLDFAERSDWRLPSIKEAYSLIIFSGKDASSYTGSDTSTLVPFIDSAFDWAFGDLTTSEGIAAGDRIIDGQYASATLYGSTTMNGDETMFGVNYVDGRIKGYPTQLKEYYVRCVAGNTDYGTNNFSDNGDGTISDEATGLMWQQEDTESTNWDDAVAQCESATTASLSDWRLPNAKALQSIVDYTRSPDITASAAIDAVFDSTSFTNEENVTDWGYYWSSSSHVDNDGDGSNAAYVSFGRALGYMNSNILDVHGAGSQRSDDKLDVSAEPGAQSASGSNGTFYYKGPQGDILRNNNKVRCVRDI